MRACYRTVQYQRSVYLVGGGAMPRAHTHTCVTERVRTRGHVGPCASDMLSSVCACVNGGRNCLRLRHCWRHGSAALPSPNYTRVQYSAVQCSSAARPIERARGREGGGNARRGKARRLTRFSDSAGRRRRGSELREAGAYRKKAVAPPARGVYGPVRTTGTTHARGWTQTQLVRHMT